MNAAWLRGIRDLLDCLPTVEDLDQEDLQANDVVSQGRPGDTMVNPEAYPPPQYSEAIQATIRWLRGEAVVNPVDQAAYGPYPLRT